MYCRKNLELNGWHYFEFRFSTPNILAIGFISICANDGIISWYMLKMPYKWLKMKTNVHVGAYRGDTAFAENSTKNGKGTSMSVN